MFDKNPLYLYTGKIEKVIDGDTLDVTIDVGFNLKCKDRIRLFGVNSPEMSTPEGVEAKKYLESLIDGNGSDIIFYSIKDRRETFGRYLGVLYFGTGSESLANKSINKTILESGHGKAKYISAGDLKEL